MKAMGGDWYYEQNAGQVRKNGKEPTPPPPTPTLIGGRTAVQSGKLKSSDSD